MSRESDLNIRFSVTETEMPLAKQLADLLKEQFSIDRISTSEKGYSIEVWNSEHYYLSEVMPLITRIVAAVFPDREIISSGSGEYSVSDDIYEYSAKYDPKYKEVSCGRHHRWEGNQEEEAEQYSCKVGLTEEEFEHLIPFTDKPGYSQLYNLLDTIKNDPVMHVKSSRWNIRYYENIPYGVKNIRSNEFYNCGSITSITIPDSVTSIGNSAFYGCGSLTSITIPGSVTSIGESAFEGCTNLTSVMVPETVSIGSRAFADTPFEKSLYDDPANWEDGILYLGNVLIKAGESLSGEHTIKAGVKGIAGGAFMFLDGLTGIIIPDSVLWIGDSAFCECNNLASVTIPDSVKSIDYETFEGCEKLTSVNIPFSVTSIGWAAFYYCSSLATITIPDSVTSIDDFAFDGCDKLTIHAPAGSTAEAYAKANGIPFAAI